MDAIMANKIVMDSIVLFYDPSRKLLTSCKNKLPTFNRFLAELLSVLAPEG